MDGPNDDRRFRCGKIGRSKNNLSISTQTVQVQLVDLYNLNPLDRCNRQSVTEEQARFALQHLERSEFKTYGCEIGQYANELINEVFCLDDIFLVTYCLTNSMVFTEINLNSPISIGADLLSAQSDALGHGSSAPVHILL